MNYSRTTSVLQRFTPVLNLVQHNTFQEENSYNYSWNRTYWCYATL